LVPLAAPQCLPGGGTAVDRQRGAGDEGGFIAEEDGHERRDLVSR
jgi:hypothetical protein